MAHVQAGQKKSLEHYVFMFSIVMMSGYMRLFSLLLVVMQNL